MFCAPIASLLAKLYFTASSTTIAALSRMANQQAAKRKELILAQLSVVDPSLNQ